MLIYYITTTDAVIQYLYCTINFRKPLPEKRVTLFHTIKSMRPLGNNLVLPVFVLS